MPQGTPKQELRTGESAGTEAHTSHTNIFVYSILYTWIMRHCQAIHMAHQRDFAC